MRLLLLSLLLGIGLSASAQDSKANQLLANILAEDSTVFEALAFYPRENQYQLIIAGEHPAPLVNLQRLQIETEESFQILLADLEQEEAAILYRFSRFPDLVEALVQDSNMSKKELKVLAAQYPDYMQKEIKKYGSQYPSILQSIYAQSQTNESTFQELISPLPEGVQSVMQQLTHFPEVLNLLTNNMHLAILLGELYEVDSSLTRQVADSAYEDILKVRREELEIWTTMVKGDPLAFQELRQAAEDFCLEVGISLKDTRSPESGLPSQMEEIVNPQVYPYWFGYPWWYKAPYWRRSPYWYHTGFYLDKKDNASFVGLPSYLFIYWQMKQIEQYPRTYELYQAFLTKREETESAFSIAMENHCPVADSLVFEEAAKPPKKSPKLVITTPPVVKSYRYFLAVDHHRSKWLKNQISRNLMKY